MANTTRGGKKNRKHGRNLRRPGKLRYTLERRWITNKARRVLRCNGERAFSAWCERLNPEDASRVTTVVNLGSRRWRPDTIDRRRAA